MLKSISFSFLLLFATDIYSQAKVDLDRSVPLWMETDSVTNQSKLKWIGDENATNYNVSEVSGETNLTLLGALDGTATEFEIGELERGKEYGFHISKGSVARGIIQLGLELPATHIRGRCLIIIDDILLDPLDFEIQQLMEDMSLDGWTVDTLQVSQSDDVVSIKIEILDWYEENYEYSQSLFLLGHVPVPYSGNSAHDGHPDHQGAWPADVYYGELDGFWRDATVNNTSPARNKNKNVPFDGKYDQTLIPSDVELEVGRVDFHNLPAFPDDEIELTRQYLIKSHDFKMGNKEYPRRALVENNFGGFPEGFGQSGWRNFTTMFGGDNVTVENYDVIMETEKYLFSYACGGGSYTSCAGVGNTSNLWVAKDIQSVFTMTFGSYFGDWDSQNNFLRSALGSGDILTNAWAGRPVWQFYDMSIGRHIGYSARKTQNATGSFYSQSNSAKSAHIALMGDPTLRLHPVKSASNLIVVPSLSEIGVVWEESSDASHGYMVYRRENEMDWLLIAEFLENNGYLDFCVKPNTAYEYMVKAVKLEKSGSGSYFNTSLGITSSVQSGPNSNMNTYYADVDMDGYGNPEDSLESCNVPLGYVENGMDCDDMNSDINPNAEDIPNNGIDENCDGLDLMVGVDDLDELNIKVYPKPTDGILLIEGNVSEFLFYKLYNAQGKMIRKGRLDKSIDISGEVNGLYWLMITSDGARKSKAELVLLID